MPKCQFCGILVPVQELVKEYQGKKLVFCGEKCFRLYVTYKFPKYGG